MGGQIFILKSRSFSSFVHPVHTVEYHLALLPKQANTLQPDQCTVVTKKLFSFIKYLGYFTKLLYWGIFTAELCSLYIYARYLQLKVICILINRWPCSGIIISWLAVFHKRNRQIIIISQEFFTGHPCDTKYACVCLLTCLNKQSLKVEIILHIL